MNKKIIFQALENEQTSTPPAETQAVFLEVKNIINNHILSPQ